MIIRAARRLFASGVLVGIVTLSSGCGVQSTRPGPLDSEAEGWGFGQVTSGDGRPVTDSGARPELSDAERGKRSRYGLRPAGNPDASQAGGHDLWARIRSGFRLPSPDNPAVDAEVDWFVRNQGFIERTINRAQPYLYHIVEQVEARDVPSEIALLPVVESAFQPFAYSPARAAGIWQFIPETGRRFGLRQSWWYDGRRDVIASTRAALDYLTALQEQFGGDWLLAIAAYNCGEGNVARAIQENQRRGLPTDFWSLPLPDETRSYVPRLLAFSRVVSDPGAYGLQLASIPNAPYITRVSIDGPIDLNVAAGVA